MRTSFSLSFYRRATFTWSLAIPISTNWCTNFKQRLKVRNKENKTISKQNGKKIANQWTCIYTHSNILKSLNPSPNQNLSLFSCVPVNPVLYQVSYRHIFFKSPLFFKSAYRPYLFKKAFIKHSLCVRLWAIKKKIQIMSYTPHN